MKKNGWLNIIAKQINDLAALNRSDQQKLYVFRWLNIIGGKSKDATAPTAQKLF